MRLKTRVTILLKICFCECFVLLGLLVLLVIEKSQVINHLGFSLQKL